MFNRTRIARKRRIALQPPQVGFKVRQNALHMFKFDLRELVSSHLLLELSSNGSELRCTRPRRVARTCKLVAHRLDAMHLRDAALHIPELICTN